MSKLIAEVKDAFDRGVQIKLDPEGIVTLSGPDGVIKLKRGGTEATLAALDNALSNEKIAEEPVAAPEPSGDEGEDGESEAPAEKKSKPKKGPAS